jgi:low affinity Fe/Cu permease
MGRDGGHGCRLGRDVAQPADRLTGTISLQGRYGRMRKFFNLCATKISTAAGQPLTFIAALTVILIWAVTGPVFHYSDTWQLIINTGTTIITFLMVFLIQNSQNRDGAAMQAKLDELLRAVDKARESFIGIEHLTDNQIELLRAALERHAQQLKEKGKQQTAEDTVDRLLDRF